MEASLRARQVRAARNQALFREVNERIGTIGAAVSEEIGYVCECLDLECGAQIQLTIEQYEAVREADTRFFVLPGHVYRDVEKVVDDRGSYVVVEKIEAAAEVAASLDQRSSPR